MKYRFEKFNVFVINEILLKQIKKLVNVVFYKKRIRC